MYALGVLRHQSSLVILPQLDTEKEVGSGHKVESPITGSEEVLEGPEGSLVTQKKITTVASESSIIV